MDAAMKTGVWIIAAGVIITGLKVGQAILAPFALAVFLFFVIEGLAQEIDERSETLKRGASRFISVFTILAGFAGFIVLMARGISQFSSQATVYEVKLNALSADVYALFGLGDAPTVMDLFSDAGGQLVGVLSGAAANLSESFLLVLVYVAFLYIARPAWPKKLDAIFGGGDNRATVRAIGDDAKRGIEAYVWTQTVISAIITILTYATLVLLGVNNALFLAGLIFVLCAGAARFDLASLVARKLIYQRRHRVWRCQLLAIHDRQLPATADDGREPQPVGIGGFIVACDLGGNLGHHRNVPVCATDSDHDDLLCTAPFNALDSHFIVTGWQPGSGEKGCRFC